MREKNWVVFIDVMAGSPSGGSLTPDVVRCMNVTQFNGVGHIANCDSSFNCHFFQKDVTGY